MKRILVFACILCFWCSVPLLCSAQSVADAARKERDRQKNLKSTVIVATGNTIAGATATTAAGTAATTAGESPKPGGLKDNNGHDEKYWQDRFQQARDDVQRAEAKAQIADTKIKDLNTQMLRQSDVYNRENRIAVDLTDTQKELAAAQKEADQARQKVTDLEDELRRAGGPPGWAR